MRTQGHAVINLCVLGEVLAPGSGPAVLAGAIVPDLPIVVLWTRERLRGRPEEDIWRSVYPKKPWIDLIHGAHSLPLAALGLAASALLSAPAGVAFFASVLLHSLSDLPLHAEDAHRHFLPLSSWRFVSPISYWDVRHHGRTVTFVEMLAVMAAGACLWPGAAMLERAALVAVALGYVRSSWRVRAGMPHPVS